MDTARIHRSLPVPAQHAACSAAGWWIQHRRFDRDFRRLLAEYESRSGWSDGELAAFRDARLRATVAAAARDVPFYAGRFRELGVDPQELRTLADLTVLPILTKGEVKAAGGAILSPVVPRRLRRAAHTSGTTGEALTYMRTLAATREQWAAYWRYRRRHGIELGTWSAVFGGWVTVPLEARRPPFWRYNVPGRQILFSVYHMGPSTLDDYVGELRRRRPPWITGWASCVAVLAAHVLERGSDLGYAPRWVTTGAETLLPQQVELIEQAFGVRPRQHYGLMEAVANISECERGLLHVDEDFAAVEFLTEGDGGAHRIVGTSFSNPLMPLVRYDTGDLAVLAEGPCACGRAGRLVASLDGRIEDHIVRPDGSRVIAIEFAFRDSEGIREAQVRQGRPDHVTLRLAVGPAWTGDDEDLLVGRVGRLLGPTMDVSVEYVEQVERARNGKLRFIVSDVPEAWPGRLAQSAAARSA